MPSTLMHTPLLKIHIFSRHLKSPPTPNHNHRCLGPIASDHGSLPGAYSRALPPIPAATCDPTPQVPAPPRCSDAAPPQFVRRRSALIAPTLMQQTQTKLKITIIVSFMTFASNYSLIHHIYGTKRVHVGIDCVTIRGIAPQQP